MSSTKSNEGSQNSYPVLERNLGNVMSHPSGQTRSRTSTLTKMNSVGPRSTPTLEHNNDIQQIPHTQQSPRQNQTSKSTKRNKGQCRNRNEWNKEISQTDNEAQK